jgi:hypothetical protein
MGRPDIIIMCICGGSGATGGSGGRGAGAASENTPGGGGGAGWAPAGPAAMTNAAMAPPTNNLVMILSLLLSYVEEELVRQSCLAFEQTLRRRLDAVIVTD